MKKIVLLLLIIFIDKLEASEITKYKWYYETITDIKYVSDENMCSGTIDFKNILYTDWNYSLDKPENKVGRIIEKNFNNIELSRKYTKELFIELFTETGNDTLIYDFIILDENNKKLDYEVYPSSNSEYILDGDITTSNYFNWYYSIRIKFKDIKEIDKFIIKVVHSENIKTRNLSIITYLNDEYASGQYKNDAYEVHSTCEDKKCVSDYAIIPRLDTIDVETNVYKYKDVLFKCYFKDKIYLEGYYDNIDGLFRDDSNYIVENVEDVKKSVKYLYKTEYITKLVNPEINTNTKKVVNDKDNNNMVWMIIIAIVCFILLLLIIKKILKNVD